MGPRIFWYFFFVFSAICFNPLGLPKCILCGSLAGALFCTCELWPLSNSSFYFFFLACFSLRACLFRLPTCLGLLPVLSHDDPVFEKTAQKISSHMAATVQWQWCPWTRGRDCMCCVAWGYCLEGASLLPGFTKGASVWAHCAKQRRDAKYSCSSKGTDKNWDRTLWMSKHSGNPNMQCDIDRCYAKKHWTKSVCRASVVAPWRKHLLVIDVRLCNAAPHRATGSKLWIWIWIPRSCSRPMLIVLCLIKASVWNWAVFDDTGKQLANGAVTWLCQ